MRGPASVFLVAMLVVAVAGQVLRDVGEEVLVDEEASFSRAVDIGSSPAVPIAYGVPFGPWDGVHELGGFLPFRRFFGEHSDGADRPLPLLGIRKPDVVVPLRPASILDAGVPPLPVLPLQAGRPEAPLDNELCGPHRLRRPCSQRCSLEWNPVLAECEGGRTVRFINCCSWHRDVCLFNRKCNFLRHEGPIPCRRGRWE